MERDALTSLAGFEMSENGTGIDILDEVVELTCIRNTIYEPGDDCC